MSNKPTIFFSHSSKDCSILLDLKNRLNDITGGTLDIFMSSDGQSIPFGTNWVNRIEQGLNEAKIMFIFVTQNSLLSNWIYFEAGFAYSKGLEVIPVGIGVDIALLKPPLSLLQGFNITSADSLNNIITTLNKKFDFSYKTSFSDDDYRLLLAAYSAVEMPFEANEVFESINHEMLSEYGDGKGGKIKYNLDKFFEKIIQCLEDRLIPYSLEEKSQSALSISKTLLTMGIKIHYRGEKSQPESFIMTFWISPYNFANSFGTYLELIKLFDEKQLTWLHFRLNNTHQYVIREEALSSIITQHRETYAPEKDSVGVYKYLDKMLRFNIHDKSGWRDKKVDYVLWVSFQPQDITPRDMTAFLAKLVDDGVIFENAENL